MAECCKRSPRRITTRWRHVLEEAEANDEMQYKTSVRKIHLYIPKNEARQR
jgi:hypothetical protein